MESKARRKVLMVLVAACLVCASIAITPAKAAEGCIPDGGIDDTLGRTDCCSGSAVPGSTYCINPEDFGTSWESCSQICGYAT